MKRVGRTNEVCLGGESRYNLAFTRTFLFSSLAVSELMRVEYMTLTYSFQGPGNRFRYPFRSEHRETGV